MTEKKKESAMQKRPEAQLAELAQDRPVFVPATDIFEREDAVMVVCDVPGVDEKQVDVSLENDVLTITAMQGEESREGLELLHRGYRSGIWRRSFTLTADVNAGKIRAQIKQGVLSVILPKSEAARPRRIQVEAAG